MRGSSYFSRVARVGLVPGRMLAPPPLLFAPAMPQLDHFSLSPAASQGSVFKVSAPLPTMPPHESLATRPPFEAGAKPETPARAKDLESVPTSVGALANHTEIHTVTPSVAQILNAEVAPIRSAPPKFSFKQDEAHIAKAVQPCQGQSDIRRTFAPNVAITEQLQSPAATAVRSSFNETTPTSPSRKCEAPEAPRISDAASLPQQPSRRNETVLPRPIRQSEAITSRSYPERMRKAPENSSPRVRIGIVEVRVAPQTTPVHVSPLMSSAAGPAREPAVLARGFPSFGLSQS
jgi:hypothetical protein